MKPRSPDFEVEQRINQVFEWNLLAYSRRQIIQFAADLGWDFTDRTIDTYIAEAKRRLIEMNKDTQEEDLSRIISLLWDNYRAAEPRDKPSILRDIAKLKGLDQINLHVKIERPLKEMKDEELEKALFGEEG